MKPVTNDIYCWYASKEGGAHLKEFFHLPHHAFVRQEDDDVVVWLDARVGVGDDDARALALAALVAAPVSAGAGP